LEGVLVILCFVFFFIGAPSSVFLVWIQPLWALIDIAVSDKLSKGAKTVLLILILAGVPLCIISGFGIVFVPFILLIPLFYGFFVTASSVLRKATRISFLFLVCALIGIATTAALSSQVRANIQQFKNLKREGNRIYLESQETGEEEADSSVHRERSAYRQIVREPIVDTLAVDYSVDPFYAIHFVPPSNESVATFTLDGADLDSATPFRRPSIYPLNHIAVDPAGPLFYGVTTHKFGKIDSQTGEFEEIHVNDQSVPKLSWPGGIAFDTRRERIFITSRGKLYLYYPETDYWEIVADSSAIPVVYNPREDLLYGLESGGRVMKKINMRGAVVGELNLSQQVPTAKTWDDLKVQVLWSSDKILVLVSKNDLQIYIVDPSDGEVLRYKQ
jgi:hypothetical protein